MAILSITNWTNSKASHDADGGQSSLEGWLKRKAKRDIIASQRDGDVLQIQVADKDKRSFLHVNGFQWAGTNVNITEGQAAAPPPPRGPRSQGGFNQNQRNGDLSSRITGGPNGNFNHQNRNQQKELFGNPPSGPRGGGFQQNRQQNGTSNNSPFTQSNSSPFAQNNQQQSRDAPDEAQQALIQVIRNRYNAAQKFLNLSELATDPAIQQAGLDQMPAEKVFKALFAVLEQHVFETREKRAEMIETVSFAKNNLTTVKDIIGASSTFYKIKNLDLSENKFDKINALTWWKSRFPDLEQIMLAGNPVDGPQTRAEVQRWFKKLKTYNMQPLDAQLPTATMNGLEVNPPVPTPSPAPQSIPDLARPEGHPEFGPGSDFGLPMPNKPQDLWQKEQIGLRLSYATRLKMVWVEKLLLSNDFNYDNALTEFNNAMNQGQVPHEAFLG